MDCLETIITVSNMTQWYVAVLVMECRIDGQSGGMVDLQVRLISADSLEHAYERARLIGREAEVRYKNADGDDVTWEFKGLQDLDVILDETLGDGTEVWSLRSSKSPDLLVLPKEKLSAFWLDANKHRRVDELLEESD